MKVYNKHHQDAPSSAVYIGRGTPWGTPFRIGPDGDRAAVCLRYKQMVQRDPAMQARIRKELKGRDLVCFCAPLQCHGDYLLEVANK